MVIADAPARHPALAGALEDGGRFYTFGDPLERFYSVTTIINGGVPKYLHLHYAKMAAELALAGLEKPNSRASAILRRWERAGREWVAELQAAGELRSIKADKLTARDFAARWLKGAADRHRDAAAARGSAVHAAAEDLVVAQAREATRLILEGERLPAWPDAIAPWMASFVEFVTDWKPEYLAAEATVFNRREAYAGTLDAVVRIPLLSPRPMVLDYKAGREIYPEVALQLAAYARGEFIGHPNRLDELPMPDVDQERALVLHLTEKGYRLRSVAIGAPAWDAFRYAREVFRWATDTSRTVLGKPLDRAAEEENVQYLVESQMAIGFDPSPRGA